MRKDRTSPQAPIRPPSPRPVLLREERADFGFTYGRTGPHPDAEPPLISESAAIDFAFVANPNALVRRPSGRTECRSVAANAGGSVGEPLAWVSVPDASEFLEVRPSREGRLAVAEDLRRSDLADLGERFGPAEPWLIHLASRLRAHALGGRPVGDLEGEALVGLALRRTLVALGAREGPRALRGLDAKRVSRVAAYVEANLHRPLRGLELADVAAVSRFHFTRMFALAVGAPPHAFVTARRMERARTLLDHGRSCTDAARAVGYAPGHQFRRALRAHLGSRPRR